MGLKKRPTKRRPNKPKQCNSKTKKSTSKVLNKNPKPVSVTRTSIPVRSYEHCHDRFLTYSEIRDFLQKMTTNYPEKIKVVIVGHSSEGKPIYLAKISELSTEEPKMATLVEAGSDGTDWMAVSSALYLISFLTKNNSYTKIMDYLILPCSNPDAYHYSISNCKSAKASITMSLSNNFPLTLGLNDVTSQRTEGVLLGIKKWKENFKFGSPETLALIKTITAHQFSVKLFISLQEEGEKIVYPFGFCKENVVDYEELKAVAKSGQTAVKCRCLQIGSVINLCGLTYGTVIDFLRTNQRAVKFTYILHLRVKKKKPESRNIISCGNDVLNCVRAMARNVFMHYKKFEDNKRCTS
ncbi:unnamed protein product [Phaedon cochleariae]|uniref:Peptidase M14 domain-containing protein n=1 Tax=Phaedon cochleariae TaxID=80249 RepID=A0A9P0DQR2_PHACE|nr:unnamed protein product [Phaedon cochleariae]